MVRSVTGGRVLLNLPDSVTTDHISPAGSIARNSPAARYLAARKYVEALPLHVDIRYTNNTSALVYPITLNL